jgi:hypothetical protein
MLSAGWAGSSPVNRAGGFIKPRFGLHPAERGLHGLGLDSAVSNVLCIVRARPLAVRAARVYELSKKRFQYDAGCGGEMG